jgi:REP element-mobilizing transposase RayT
MDFWEISDEKLTIFIVELRTDHIHYLWVFSSCGKQQNFDPETSKKLRSN